MSLYKSALLALSFTTALITAYFTEKGSLLAMLSLVGTITMLYTALDGMASKLTKVMITVAVLTGLSSLMAVKAGASFGAIGAILAGAIMFGGLQGLRLSSKLAHSSSGKGGSASGKGGTASEKGE
mgnify:CR=1 FL=1